MRILLEDNTLDRLLLLTDVEDTAVNHYLDFLCYYHFKFLMATLYFITLA